MVVMVVTLGLAAGACSGDARDADDAGSEASTSTTAPPPTTGSDGGGAATKLTFLAARLVATAPAAPPHDRASDDRLDHLLAVRGEGRRA